MSKSPKSSYVCKAVITVFVAIIALVAAIPGASAASMVRPMATTRLSSPVYTTTDPNCVQPPNNVDHATFTAAQLDLYGLPHRAKGQSLVAWQQVVRNAKHRVCTGTEINRSPVTPATVDEQIDTWGGYIAIYGGYTESVGMWKVSCLTLLLHDGAASSWVGIGGDVTEGDTNVLVQSGTTSQEYSDWPGHWNTTYWAWIEDYPWNLGQIKKFDVNCNDTMYAADWQDYSNGNPVAAHMYIQDQTTGLYAHSINYNSFSNGGTAEWIVERAAKKLGWNSDNLAGFHSLYYTDCIAIRNGAASSPINWPHNDSTMYFNGHSLVSVGSLGADSTDIGAHFTMNWLHSS